MQVPLVPLDIATNTVLSGLLWERNFLTLKLHFSSHLVPNIKPSSA